MKDEGGGFGAGLVVVAIIWLIVGHPIRDAKAWLGWLSYEEQVEMLASHVEKRMIGNTVDYWLAKETFISPNPERVALIFGIWGDLEFCSELAEMYMQRYPSSRFLCQPANAP